MATASRMKWTRGGFVPSGGTPERLTNATLTCRSWRRSTRRTLLYVARAEDRSGPWLWALDVESKISRRVSSGLEQYTSVAASADGRRIVATVANPSASLWSVPLLDRVAEDADIKPYPLPTVRALSPRFDKKASLFYLSARGTGDGLWRFRDGQASEIWKGSDGALDEPPAVSPDGRVWQSLLRRDGKRHLTTDVGGWCRCTRNWHHLSTSKGAPDWSPDARWIVIGGRDVQGPGLFKVPIDGGAPIRLSQRGRRRVRPGHRTDTLIVYSGPIINGKVQVLAVRPDGSPVAISPRFTEDRTDSAIVSCPMGRAWCTCRPAQRTSGSWTLLRSRPDRSRGSPLELTNTPSTSHRTGNRSSSTA